MLQEYLDNLVVDKHEPLPKNKQTWKKSAKSLLESSWTGDLFVNSFLIKVVMKIKMVNVSSLL